MSNERSSSSTDMDADAQTRRKLLKQLARMDDRLEELRALAELDIQGDGGEPEGTEEMAQLVEKRNGIVQEAEPLPVLGLAAEKWIDVKTLVEKNWSKFEVMDDFQAVKGVLGGAAESLSCANCNAGLCAFEHVVHVCTGKQWQWHPKLRNSAVFSLVARLKVMDKEDGGKIADMYCGECGATVGFRVKSNIDHYCVSDRAVTNFQEMQMALDKKRYKSPQSREKRVQSMFNIVDSDGDGAIRFEEFKQALDGLEIRLPGAVDARTLFTQLDREGKGAIDFYEFRDFCKRMEKWQGTDAGDRMRAIFDLVDEDGTGTIDLKQFTRALKSMEFELTAKSIASVFKAIDQTKTGSVTYEEFSCYVKSLAQRYELDPFDELEMTAEERERMTTMFKEIDTDGSGEIDWEEFVEANTAQEWGWDPAKLQAMWEEIDLDGNGTLEFDEFVKAMRLGCIPCRDLAEEDVGVENLVEMNQWQSYADRASSTVRDHADMRLIRQATGGRVDMSYLTENATKEAADKSTFSLKNLDPTPPLPKHRLDEVAINVRQLGRKFNWKIKKNLSNQIEAIPVENIAKIMRGLGHRPSNQELAEIIAHNTNADGDAVSFWRFCEMLRWYEVSVNEDQVVLYFKEFLDDGSGHMTLQKFRTLLEEINEGDMMEEDVNDVLSLVESIMNGTYKPRQEGQPSMYFDQEEEEPEPGPKISLDEKLSMDQFLTAMRVILFTND